MVKSVKKRKTHYQTELAAKLVKTKDDAGAAKDVTFKGQSL